MKDILTILTMTTKHIDIFEGKRTTEICTFIEVEEGRVQEIFDDIEEIGGTWAVAHNFDGDITIYVTFNTSSEYAVKAAKVINRHWFESKFETDKKALMEYCRDILLASK